MAGWISLQLKIELEMGPSLAIGKADHLYQGGLLLKGPAPPSPSLFLQNRCKMKILVLQGGGWRPPYLLGSFAHELGEMFWILTDLFPTLLTLHATSYPFSLVKIVIFPVDSVSSMRVTDETGFDSCISMVMAVLHKVELYSDSNELYCTIAKCS